MPAWSHLWREASAAAASLAELVLPPDCGGCGAAESRWCPECADDLRRRTYAVPRHAQPTPCPAGLPPVVAAGDYDGSLRSLVVAVKDGGRHDLARLLVPLLRAGLAGRVGVGDVLVVPMPSAPAAIRRRGADTLTELTRAALQGHPAGPIEVRSVLRATRRVADQSRLDSRARAANLAGAYAVPARHTSRVAGRRVLLVDDVLTTGATLTEGARALQEAGGEVLGAVVIAATRRRHPGGSASVAPPRRDGYG